MLSLKFGTRAAGIQPEMVLAIMVANSIFQHYGFHCTVTSMTDGQHSPRSLHYAGAAADFRTRHIVDKETVSRIAQEMRKALGPHFDVIEESTHIHVEHQPRFID